MLKISSQKISRSRKNKSNGADSFKDSDQDQLFEINKNLKAAIDEMDALKTN